MSDLLSTYLMQLIYSKMHLGSAITGQTRNKLAARWPTRRTMVAMKSRLRFILLIPIGALLGCTLPATTSPSTSTPLTGIWTNWQIQTGTSSFTPPTALTSPPTGSYLLGAMQTQGSQVTGIFNDGAGVVNFTGTFNSTTSVLGISSTPASMAVQLTLPSNLTDLAIGNFAIGCTPAPPSYATCGVILLLPAAGAEIASLTGTYTGTLADSAAPSLSGTGTLTLTQSTTPNADGSFPLAGTIAFPSSTEFGTLPLSGTISGEGIVLYDPTPGIVPVVSLTASTNPAATQITVSNLAFAVTATDIVTFSGTLTRQ
jgi:hypothetical protein